MARIRKRVLRADVANVVVTITIVTTIIHSHAAV